VDIRLIAFDLDGTILEQGGIIPEEARDVFAKAARRGVKLTTATGRPLEEQMACLDASGLGARAGFPHALIADEREIYLLKRSGYRPHRPWNDKMHKNWLKVLPHARRRIEQELEQLSAAGVTVRRHVSFDDATRRGVVDLLFETVEEAERTRRRLSAERLDPQGLLTCVRNHCLVGLVHCQAGKGNSLEALAQHWNAVPGQVLCIGDSANDLSMLDGSKGFFPAAVGNAEDLVKDAVRAAGGHVASECRSKGVVEIVRRLVLRK